MGADNENEATNLEIAMGKWRCDFQARQTCTWGMSDSRACVDINIDGKGQFEEISSWFELDLDADPVKLYFCQDIGCGTGLMSDKGKNVALEIHDGNIIFDLSFLMRKHWIAVFIVRFHMPLGSYSDVLIFRLKPKGVIETPSAPYPATLDVVGNKKLEYSIGQCKKVDKLSKPGNPIQWYFEHEEEQ
jgi:hypothetical protein